MNQKFIIDDNGSLRYGREEPLENLVTWGTKKETTCQVPRYREPSNTVWFLIIRELYPFEPQPY